MAFLFEHSTLAPPSTDNSNLEVFAWPRWATGPGTRGLLWRARPMAERCVVSGSNFRSPFAVTTRSTDHVDESDLSSGHLFPGVLRLLSCLCPDPGGACGQARIRGLFANSGYQIHRRRHGRQSDEGRKEVSLVVDSSGQIKERK